MQGEWGKYLQYGINPCRALSLYSIRDGSLLWNIGVDESIPQRSPCQEGGRSTPAYYLSRHSVGR
jgi:hypothetical protein